MFCANLKQEHDATGRLCRCSALRCIYKMSALIVPYCLRNQITPISAVPDSLTPCYRLPFPCIVGVIFYACFHYHSHITSSALRLTSHFTQIATLLLPISPFYSIALCICSFHAITIQPYFTGNSLLIVLYSSFLFSSLHRVSFGYFLPSISTISGHIPEYFDLLPVTAGPQFPLVQSVLLSSGTTATCLRLFHQSLRYLQPIQQHPQNIRPHLCYVCYRHERLPSACQHFFLLSSVVTLILVLGKSSPAPSSTPVHSESTPKISVGLITTPRPSSTISLHTLSNIALVAMFSMYHQSYLSPPF